MATLGRMKTCGGFDARSGSVIFVEVALGVDSVSGLSFADGLEARVRGIVGGASPIANDLLLVGWFRGQEIIKDLPKLRLGDPRS